MRLDVNATRMELLRLKRRIAIAQRGHKLLKDKQDELMKQLMVLVRVIRELRERVESELSESFRRFLFARAAMMPEAIDQAFLMPTTQVTLDVQERYIMSVRVPVLSHAITGSILCYGFATTSGELDASLLSLEKALDGLIELAEKEKRLQLLADEIEKTRRRVNALEYVLIPNLAETIRYITMKLAEMERGNLTRLMRVKEMVREE
jgi:V/A-type H+-transporting ATPase subunit D